jgi:hypothetical protein
MFVSPLEAHLQLMVLNERLMQNLEHFSGFLLT